MVKRAVPAQPAALLRAFAEMCRLSRAYDGDWQGDGWGVTWAEEGGGWKSMKSIRPIWEATPAFDELPESRVLIAHARSASFPQQKGVLDYNQPFTLGPYAFVFNGFLQGVSFPGSVPGKIGSQKIWTILVNLLGRYSPEEAILRLKEMLKRNSRLLQALNIGLCDRENVFSYCYYTRHREYYNLQFHDSASLKMISSEPLSGWDFNPVAPGEVVSF